MEVSDNVHTEPIPVRIKRIRNINKAGRNGNYQHAKSRAENRRYMTYEAMVSDTRKFKAVRQIEEVLNS